MLPGTEIGITGLAIAGIAAAAAGAINAIAGGGTLVSFPALIAIGVSPVAANVTNAVALCPGFAGGMFGQRSDLTGQGRRIRLLVPASMIGGVAGGALLLAISQEVFTFLVPFLILLASLLLAVQGRLRGWILDRSGRLQCRDDGTRIAILPVGLSAVYGGYFGAGQSVILLAVFGLFMEDTLTRLNALKQCLALSSNIAAAVFFLFSGLVVWPVAAVMAASALAGGVVGGRFAGSINPGTLRWTVVTIGILVGIILLVQR